MGWKYKDRPSEMNFTFTPSDMDLVIDHFIEKFDEEITLKKLKEEVGKYTEGPIFTIKKSMMGKTRIKGH